MRASLPFYVLLIAGCSSSSSSSAPQASVDATTSPTATSGSRLRAKYATFGEARQLVGFFDTQRQEDCTFQPAETGHVRCLPSNMIVGSGGGSGYSDPACSVPVVALPKSGCAAPSYVLEEDYDNSTCKPAPGDIRKVLPDSAPFYGLTGGGTCGEVAAGSGASGLRLGDIVPFTEFADGTLTNEPGAVRVSTSDGASVPYRYHLDAFDADCRFRVMADGTARCVPDAPTGSLLYSDASCTKPSAVYWYNQNPVCNGVSTPDASLWIDDGSRGADSEPSGISCSGIAGVYTLSSAIPTTGQLYESRTPTVSDSTTCTAPDYYRSEMLKVGDEISGSLPSAPRQEAGSGRLVGALVTATASDGTFVLSPGFHDTQLDLDCTLETATDGKLRCLPVAPAATLFFADATCASPSLVAVLAGECESAGDKRYGRVVSTTCPPVTTVYALSDATKDYPVGSIFTGPSRCAQVSGIDHGHDATVADPAQFAEGQLFTE